MGNSYGRQLLTPQVGNGLMALANLDDAIFKPGGITVDWSTVAAVASTPVTLNDGTVVAVGQKALRYGQVMCQITASGLYGPYDVLDTTLGRGTLVRGKCFVMNQTVLENGVMPGLPTPASNHPPGAFYAGLAWFTRLIIGSNTHELDVIGPTVALFEAAFPMINYAQ